MNPYLLWIVTVCYAGTGLQYFWKGLPARGTFWTRYAIANVAFMRAVAP